MYFKIDDLTLAYTYRQIIR